MNRLIKQPKMQGTKLSMIQQFQDKTRQTTQKTLEFKYTRGNKQIRHTWEQSENKSTRKLLNDLQKGDQTGSNFKVHRQDR